MPANDQRSPTLLLIALFKLLKAALLFAIAVGAHRLLSTDVQTTFVHWAHALRVDPDNHIVHAVLSRITGLTPHQLQALSIGTILYGLLFTTEGVGLLLRRRWAESLTVISTALLLPVEIYELAVHVTWIKLSVLITNAAIVAYLLHRLRSSSHRPIPPLSPPPPSF
jgi:uncharacterized membrane protein (DUF2068 family)